tara:strand:- start:62126 stop:62350 length:225 start_codon:yes stop_codon:yes gene_type:complete
MKTKEEIQKIIGLNLKRERNSAGISQFDLAIQADLHRNMIDLIERGKTMPTVYTLLKIADSLEIDVSDLLISIN